jgi:predicted DsbA family dithiol-disulfide isomerase
VRIDVWSDLVCPWCYIGKRRLERALEGFSHRDDVEIVHRSFQLDPSAPPAQTRSRREMLMAKYRLTEAQVDEMDVRMQRTAAADGLDYHLEGTVTGNTFDAHRVLHLASDRGLQGAVLERLYRAYFTEQRSLFDRDSLVALAAEAGLDPEEARRMLHSETYADRVEADLKAARVLGATGVPFFVIDNRYGVSGAQPADVFAGALTRAWNEQAAVPVDQSR